MAVNEIQKAGTKAELYAILRGLANESVRYFEMMEKAKVVLDTYVGADLTALTIPAAEQNILADLRVMIGEINDIRAGTSVTPAELWDTVLSNIHDIRPL